MKKFSYLKECIVCRNNKLKKVISFKKHFVSGKFIPKNQKVINEVKTPLTLLLCKDRSCGHLQLKEIVNPKILFNQTFYRSSMNSTMRTQLKDVVSKTVQLATPIKNDLIIDIGSNDSTLLSFYRKKFNLIGFEPSNKIIRVKTKNKIKVIENFFNLPDIKKITNKKAKIITSCAMFYAVSNPLDFIKNISLLLDPDGVWTLQMTYLPMLIINNNFYDICHEHLSYYTFVSFKKLLDQTDLRILDFETNDVNGGSIRFYIVKNSSRKFSKLIKINKIKNQINHEIKKGYNKPETFIKFRKKIEYLKNKTNKYIKKFNKKKKMIVALGASTKGNVLLSLFNISKKEIPYIIDKNPMKKGLKSISNQIEIISEQDALHLDIKSKIVLPWYFKTEIINREKLFIKNGGELYFPMPYPHVIKKNK